LRRFTLDNDVSEFVVYKDGYARKPALLITQIIPGRLQVALLHRENLVIEWLCRSGFEDG
jgi:hypothetical protein